MNLNVSAWSIRQPVPSVIAFLFLMVVGWTSFKQLPITKFPNIDVPIIQTRVYQPGAAPVELETQITKKIEDAVAGVNGIKHITSVVTEGASITTIEFRLEINSDRALNDTKDAVARIRSELPRGIEEPVVARLDIEGLPIVTYAARAPGMTPEQVSWFVDDVVIRALQGVKGVGSIERVGGVDREIRISLDADRLNAFGVTAGDVNRQIRATNIDLAGGRGEIAGREQAIRTLAGKSTVADLAATMIALPKGRKVRLDQLGTITDGAAETRIFATYNTQPVVAFSIVRAKGASDLTVSADVDKAVRAIAKAHPDVELKLIDTTTTSVRGSYESTMHALLEGAALAILVVLVFLKDIRATIITAIALPLSIIPSYFVLDMMGFSLNLVSLLAITIATGILVDDAIVEIENIVRHMRTGKSAYRASIEAADEIGLAVMAITATIIAVFTPVSFMGGIAGQYFKQFGLTVAISVFFSLLVARFVTPMLSAYFLRSGGHAEIEPGWLRAYTRLVRWSVRHRFLTVGAGLVIFAASIGSFFLLPTAFIPADDSGRALLAIELPPGTMLEETRRVTNDLTKRIQTRADVKSVFVNGGKLLGTGAEVRKATLVINLVDKEQRKLSQVQISEEIGRDLALVPDMRYWFLRDNGQRGFALVVAGRDGAAVNRVAADLTSQARRMTGEKGEALLTNVVSTAELDRPELRVRPKTELAAELGVTTDVISEAVRIATIGDVDANLAKFNIDDRQIPIRVELDTRARSSRETLEQLKVATASGAVVPLSQVADFELSQGPTSIDRYDRQRRVLIGGDLAGTTPLGAAVAGVMKQPAAKAVPEGVELKQFGDVEVMKEVFESFAKAMALGIMLVYAVLVLLFGSFLQPITILFSLPLSIGGAIFALFLTGQAVSMPVVIGILMLMGIVTKNAIMLVDFTLEQIAKGMKRSDAIVDAGRKRARPIVMTTIAMVGGMLPAAFNTGSGGEFRVPMAIAVIGGLISSTLLSLVFVPAVYAVMDDLGKGVWYIFGRFVGPTDEAPVEAEAKPVTPAKPRSVERPMAAE
jgi:hydrophobe/amphiphile efflux-1 (HAE1) family protein